MLRRVGKQRNHFHWSLAHPVAKRRVRKGCHFTVISQLLSALGFGRVPHGHQLPVEYPAVLTQRQMPAFTTREQSASDSVGSSPLRRSQTGSGTGTRRDHLVLVSATTIPCPGTYVAGARTVISRSPTSFLRSAAGFTKTGSRSSPRPKSGSRSAPSPQLGREATDG